MFLCLEDKAADGEWTIEEATSNLRGNQWKTTFKGGVNLNEKVLQEHAFDKTPQDHEDFSSRYDLTFVMPNSRQIKLWVRSNCVYFFKSFPYGAML